MSEAAAWKVVSTRPEVRCPQCHQRIFDGEAVTARVVRVLARGAEAKCKVCRTWVRVPLAYAAPTGGG